MLQYAVEALKVEHVIVVGHYGCGGVRAAYEGKPLGLIDNWLRHVQDVAALHAGDARRDARRRRAHRPAVRAERDRAGRGTSRGRRSCRTRGGGDSRSRSTRGSTGCSDGLVRDLGLEADSPPSLAELYPRAIAGLDGPGD